MRHLLFIVRGCRAVRGFWQMVFGERRSYPGMQIKMIGIDLDGTLLTKNKVMTSVSRQALEKAIPESDMSSLPTGQTLMTAAAEKSCERNICLMR